jgi:Xaa-Pro aminopeptidase
MEARMKIDRIVMLLSIGFLLTAGLAEAQEARRRWEMTRQIRLDKFDHVLPRAMRGSGIDMWIVAMKENNYDPLYDDLGRGYVGSIGYYVFTDRGGDRIERAALGIGGYLLEQSGAYDLIQGRFDLAAFVRERDPKRIGVNISEEIGPADGLTHTLYNHLVKTLGEPYARRLVSAERLVSEFRSHRVATEIVAFGEALQISRELVERALSNEVITPGRTTLEDVAWWLQDRLLERGLASEFDMPSVYTSGPEGIIATSTDMVIVPGMLLHVDWGVRLMNMATDMKRTAYVLRPGEAKVPAGLQNAWDQAVAVREVIRRNIKVGRTAIDTLNLLNDKVAEAGFEVMKEFNRPTSSAKTEVYIGSHSVGNTGHCIGPSIATFNPLQSTFLIEQNRMFAIEFFAYTAAPEWNGKKARIPLEDDAIVTENGVEWLSPINERILVVR